MILKVIKNYSGEQKAEGMTDHGGIPSTLELRIEYSYADWGYDVLRWYPEVGWLRIAWTWTRWGARRAARRYRQQFGTAAERFVEDA